MWQLATTHFNNDINPVLKESSFVGDAAGRHDGWMAGKKKDHSAVDRKFAMNVKVAFMTPEEVFEDRRVVLPEIEFSGEKLVAEAGANEEWVVLWGI